MNEDYQIDHNEQSLDPADWDSMKNLAHQMVEDMFDYLKNISKQPVWKPIPEDVKKKLSVDIPLEPQSSESVYQDFKNYVLPYTKGGIHPRFFALVEGTGTPLGALADMLASTMNSNVCNGENTPMYVDNQVVQWCKQILNFPSFSSGMLVSGSSMANNIALTIARNNKVHDNVRVEGLVNVNKKMVVYCSTETHSCIQKSVEIIGLGTTALRRIPVNKNFQMEIDALKNTICEDIASGFIPICVVANAGTVNSGAIDPLCEINDLCKKYNLWFHVDGAYGAVAKLTDDYSDELLGIEYADSVGFDLHKWMYIPYEVGCVLIRNAEAHISTFSLNPEYLKIAKRGAMAGPESTNNLGFELSRGFKALKVWMSLKEHGLTKYKIQIAQNINQARYLTQLIQKNDFLELLAPQSLSIVCFRFWDSSLSEEKLDILNTEILLQLQEKGIATPSSTVLNGKFAIRVCIVNHRTKYYDLDIMLNEILKIGETLL
jgi:aromatic-L-amino-acid/L-tryptophan decarboxylase